jgi:O-antigen ligase
MALIAVFESLRHWLLYTDIVERWQVVRAGRQLISGYTYARGGSVRAQVSAGHPLALGFLLAIAFGFWLYLQSRLASARSRAAGVLVLWGGLVATYSRGPWVGATAIYFAFAALGKRALSRLFKAGAIAILIIGALSLTSPGERLINTIPFLGGTEATGSVLYRHQLAERSWEVIQEHPLFGSSLALSEMQDLRQGEGIIDLVNTYAEIALFYGLVGLSLFVGFMLIGLFKAYRLASKAKRTDPDSAMLGGSLVAGIIGVMLMLENSSLSGGLSIMYYVLAGLAAGYAHRGKPPEHEATTNARQPGPRKTR